MKFIVALPMNEESERLVLGVWERTRTNVAHKAPLFCADYSAELADTWGVVDRQLSTMLALTDGSKNFRS